MDAKKIFLAVILPTVLGIAVLPCFAAESEVVKKFTEALDSKNAIKMDEVIKANKEKIPDEVKTLLDAAIAPDAKEDEKESNFYLAELLAKGYSDATGDFKPLKSVKTVVFNSKLTPATRSKAENGVHTVIAPKSTDHVKNVFLPDNIIIKKGETVKWVNNDDSAHVLVSMPVIGIGGIKATRVEPGQSWEFKFEKPGDYYYICYIHKGMVGRITVEE
ncbi:hypothetical protein EPN18_10160 [bacterium]|nr:MAG: hypothetical protein EPN18_10160 [bacterium]